MDDYWKLQLLCKAYLLLKRLLLSLSGREVSIVIKPDFTDCDDLWILSKFAKQVKLRSIHCLCIVWVDPNDCVYAIMIVCHLSGFATRVNIISDADNRFQTTCECPLDHLFSVLVKCRPLQMRMGVDQVDGPSAPKLGYCMTKDLITFRLIWSP